MVDLEVHVLCLETYGSRNAQRYHALPDGRLSCIPDRPEDTGYQSLRDIFMVSRHLKAEVIILLYLSTCTYTTFTLLFMHLF